MICPFCQADNREGARYCNECGLPLSGIVAQMASVADCREEPTPRPEPERDSEPEQPEQPQPPEQPAVSPESPETEEPLATDFDDPYARRRPVPSAGEAKHLDADQLPAIAVESVNADEYGRIYRAEDFSDDPSPARRREPIETHPEEGTLLYRGDSRKESGQLAATDQKDASGDAAEPDLVPASDHRRSYRAPDAPARRSRTGKVVLALALVLVLVAGGAYATYSMELWGGKTVPSVVGRTQTDAVYMLEQSGFTVSVTLVKSDATEGIVLSQSPSSGSKTSRGAEVVIRVSSPRTVPEVVGLSRSEAVTLLEEEGVFNVVVKTQKSDEQAGTVLSVSPEEGEKIEATTTVTLTVAAPYTVPDVTGMTAEEAQEVLEEEGYVVVISYVTSDTVESGCVVSTSRAAGSVLAKGSTVTVYVAQSLAEALVEATYDYLEGLATIELSGTTYEIVSIDGVTYAQDYTLAFTITAHAVTWLDGEQVTASDRQINATIIWDEDGNVVRVF